MSDTRKSLTTVAVNHAKGSAKPYKLADEWGLSLLMTPEGQRYWRFTYRFGGKAKTHALGVYPDARRRNIWIPPLLASHCRSGRPPRQRSAAWPNQSARHATLVGTCAVAAPKCHLHQMDLRQLSRNATLLHLRVAR